MADFHERLDSSFAAELVDADDKYLGSAAVAAAKNTIYMPETRAGERGIRDYLPGKSMAHTRPAYRRSY